MLNEDLVCEQLLRHMTLCQGEKNRTGEERPSKLSIK